MIPILRSERRAPSAELRAELERAIERAMDAERILKIGVTEKLVALSFAIDDAEQTERGLAREVDEQLVEELRAVSRSFDTHPHGLRAEEIVQSSATMRSLVMM
jgi:hypothetical protein